MRAKKLLLGITAAAAASIGVAACSGGGGSDGGTHDLDSGEYLYTVDDIPTNTCYPGNIGDPDGLPIPLEGVELPIDIVADSETTFSLVPPELAQTFIPPIEGTKTGNDLAANGSSNPFFLGSDANCGLSVSAVADGTMTADNTFDATITATLTAVGSGGNPVDCTAFVGTEIEPTVGLYFPQLDGPGGASGSCTLALDGNAVINIE